MRHSALWKEHPMNSALRGRAIGLAVAVLSCAIGLPAVAQVGPRAQQLEQLLKRYPEADTDKDGKLTAQEARAYLGKARAAKAGEAPAAPAAAQQKAAKA